MTDRVSVTGLQLASTLTAAAQAGLKIDHERLTSTVRLAQREVPSQVVENTASYNGATWSAVSNVDQVPEAGTGLTSVSCADAADCVLVDWEGNSLLGTG